jgi:hypothetical protein
MPLVCDRFEQPCEYEIHDLGSAMSDL